jgi:hypothetical protein
MYTTEIKTIREQLSTILALLEPMYIAALTSLHDRLSKAHIEWAVGGELGEALRTVQVKPDCIEIVTDKKGASEIFLAFKEFISKGIFFQTQRLERKAVVDKKEYPVYARSHYFEFTLAGVKIKVHGDLQYRVSDWEWGDIFDFTPEHVYVVGAKTAVVPLQFKYDLYQSLGWNDRAEKIVQVLTRRPTIPR